MPRLLTVNAILNALTRPKNGALRVFGRLAFLAGLLVLSGAAAAMELTVWRPTAGHPGIILPVRDGESPAQAANRYVTSFKANKTLMELDARSPFPN